MSARTAFVHTTSPLTVIPAGATTPLPAVKAASYTPTIGDRVAVQALDTTKLLIICKVG